MADKEKKDHCDEYSQMSRRRFLGTSALGGMIAGLPAWFPQVAFSQITPGNACPPCPFILFFGRGGWDGLSLLVPYNDPQYYTTRPLSGNLAFEPPNGGLSPREAVDLDGFFGWSQVFEQNLGAAWTQGDLAFVNAIGYTSNHSYSHFVGQYQLEVGRPAPPGTLTTGWLGRHLSTRSTPPGCSNDPIIRGLAMSIAQQRSIIGGTDTIATPKPGDYDLSGPATSINRRLAALFDLYTVNGDFVDTAAQTIASISELKKVDFDNYQSADLTRPYPNHPLGQSFRAIAAIVNNPVPLAVESFTLDFGSWDHHSNIDPTGQVGPALHYNKMRDYSEAVGAFHADMTARNNPNWAMCAMTEFGRTAKENASRGTDHAKGNCMMLMGGRVNGGIYGNWPGLANLTGNDGNDLPITTDIRVVLAELVDRCLTNSANLSTIFPNFPINPSQYLGIF